MAHFQRGPNEDPEEFADRMGHEMAKMFPPGHFDRQLRQALQMLWFTLPKAQRNVEGLELEARKVFERVIKDLREDGGRFREGDG